MKIPPNTKCTICNQLATEFHHVKHRAAGGPDEPWNLLPVCRYDHVKIHTTGLKRAAERNPELTAWLLANGWAIEDGRKWRRLLGLAQAI